MSEIKSMIGETKTSEEWAAECIQFLQIKDPDGWDRGNFDDSWNEPITKEEFLKRVMHSTIQADRIMFEAWCEDKDPVEAALKQSKQVKRGEGAKYDDAKPQWNLLPMHTLTETVKVLTFGAKKYAPDNWKKVDDAKNRYFAAMMRHIEAYQRGELNDPESGLSHLAHANCCLLFLIHFEQEETDAFVG